jgi:hypothetical protein
VSKSWLKVSSGADDVDHEGMQQGEEFPVIQQRPTPRAGLACAVMETEVRQIHPCLARPNILGPLPFCSELSCPLLRTVLSFPYALCVPIHREFYTLLMVHGSLSPMYGSELTLATLDPDAIPHTQTGSDLWRALHGKRREHVAVLP